MQIVMETIGLLLAVIGALASMWFLYEKIFPLRRLHWRAAEKAANRIAHQMKREGYSPTLIVGIGRGGAIMGSLISGCLGHRPLLVIDRKYMWVEGRRIDNMIANLHLPIALIERVLLVAGEAHSGNTMRLYHKFFNQMGARQIKRSAFFVQRGCTELIEYVGIQKERDFLMPWMFSAEYVRDDRSQEEARAIGCCSGITEVIDETGNMCCFIVRHGESTDNAGGDRYSGITECLLTEKGVEQARAVGCYLQDQRIQRIYTSPMKRSIATAREIQSLIGGHLVVEPKLREIDYGEWEGLTRKEVFQKWPDLYGDYKKDPVANTPPGGENPQRVLERFKSFWKDLQSSSATQDLSRVVIVTHNAVICIMLCYLIGIPLARYRERRVDNCSVSKIVSARDGSNNVVYENYIDHLIN